MAQGTIKLKANSAPKNQSKAGVTKKGRKTFAPKRASLVKNAGLIKVRLLDRDVVGREARGREDGEMVDGRKKKRGRFESDFMAGKFIAHTA